MLMMCWSLENTEYFKLSSSIRESSDTYYWCCRKLRIRRIRYCSVLFIQSSETSTYGELVFRKTWNEFSNFVPYENLLYPYSRIFVYPDFIIEILEDRYLSAMSERSRLQMIVVKQKLASRGVWITDNLEQIGVPHDHIKSVWLIDVKQTIGKTNIRFDIRFLESINEKICENLLSHWKI